MERRVTSRRISSAHSSVVSRRWLKYRCLKKKSRLRILRRSGRIWRARLTLLGLRCAPGSSACLIGSRPSGMRSLVINFLGVSLCPEMVRRFLLYYTRLPAPSKSLRLLNPWSRCKWYLMEWMKVKWLHLICTSCLFQIQCIASQKTCLVRRHLPLPPSVRLSGNFVLEGRVHQKLDLKPRDVKAAQALAGKQADRAFEKTNFRTAILEPNELETKGPAVFECVRRILLLILILSE